MSKLVKEMYQFFGEMRRTAIKTDVSIFNLCYNCLKIKSLAQELVVSPGFSSDDVLSAYQIPILVFMIRILVFSQDAGSNTNTFLPRMNQQKTLSTTKTNQELNVFVVD